MARPPVLRIIGVIIPVLVITGMFISFGPDTDSENDSFDKQRLNDFYLAKDVGGPPPPPRPGVPHVETSAESLSNNDNMKDEAKLDSAAEVDQKERDSSSLEQVSTTITSDDQALIDTGNDVGSMEKELDRPQIIEENPLPSRLSLENILAISADIMNNATSLNENATFSDNQHSLNFTSESETITGDSSSNSTDSEHQVKSPEKTTLSLDTEVAAMIDELDEQNLEMSAEKKSTASPSIDSVQKTTAIEKTDPATSTQPSEETTTSGSENSLEKTKENEETKASTAADGVVIDTLHGEGEEKNDKEEVDDKSETKKEEADESKTQESQATATASTVESTTEEEKPSSTSKEAVVTEFFVAEKRN